MANFIINYETGKIYPSNNPIENTSIWESPYNDGEEILPVDEIVDLMKENGDTVEFIGTPWGSEIEYACAYGDCVYVPSQTMVVIRYEWKGEHRQIFCQGEHGGPVKAGWENADGTLPEGVEFGEYYVVDDSNHWGYAEAYWQLNQDTNSPYEASDFEAREERILSRYN